jgi:glycosyltransferase involved in cell wall biosynthesis
MTRDRSATVLSESPPGDEGWNAGNGQRLAVLRYGDRVRSHSLPMKILLVNRALPVHVAGGLERHVEDLALGLAGAGLQVHLLTAPLPPDERTRLAERGIVAHAVPVRVADRYTLRYLAGVGGRIRELQARHGYDLIHAQEFALGFWNPPLSAPPLVLSVHGTITSETPLHPDGRRRLRPAEWPWALARFGRRFAYAPFWHRHLRAAARILVDSAFTRGELARIVPDCRGLMYSVPLAVRETGPSPPSHEQARRELGWEGMRLLTIGRLEWQKGQALALEALAGLRGLDWHYTIVGVGSDRRRLERLIARLRIESRVTMTGRVDEERKRLMLAGADLFLWPERTHPAFGLAGLEALLHDTPVLGTPRGAIPEVLGERGGWLAADATVDALRAALLPVMKDPELLRRRREGLRQWALTRFDFDRMIQTVLHHYRAVLGAYATPFPLDRSWRP